MSPPKEADLILPFDCSIEKIERLLLVSFEHDPDSLYIGVEIQLIPTSSKGVAPLMIAWRTDGRVDVYHSDCITPDPVKYTNVGKGLAHIVPREFIQASFEVNEKGVQANVAVEDIERRIITLQIQEELHTRRNPFSLLAPVGYASAAPSALFLVYLCDFYFVRKKGTVFKIQIGSRQHRPDLLPFPLDGKRMFFSRYSTKPLVVFFNPDFEGHIVPLKVTKGASRIETDKYEGELDWTEGIPSLKKLTLLNHFSPVELRFSPSFPSLLNFHGNERAEGTFELEANPATGKITGKYLVERQGESIVLELHPEGGWKPRPDRVSLWILFAIATVFRKWPRTYRYKAILTSQKNGQVLVKSQWRREGKI